MKYIIEYTKSADKFFRDHYDIKKQYIEAIMRMMSGDDKSIDVRRIQGKRNVYYRIRIGMYRIIYAIINGKIVVIKTLLAGSRGDVYKKTGGLK